jgi:hypothetical protein
MDPQSHQSIRIFNLTVIFDEWPVEQIAPIPDQIFYEDGKLENAFRLWDYFQDIDGGTKFSYSSHDNLNVYIDANNSVGLSSKVENWNTGEGFVDLVILAEDSQPFQQVYAVVRVRVIPVVDPDEIIPGEANYYKMIISSVVGGTLDISNVYVKYYDINAVLLYEMAIKGANPPSITRGISSIYPLPRGTGPVDNGAGSTVDSNTELKDYTNCTFAFIDQQSNGKVSADDTFFIYRDINADDVPEVTPGGTFIILDKTDKELVRQQLPVDSNISITAVIDLSGEGVDVDKIDTDSDGMPDIWEIKYGLDPTDPSDALLDIDNDSLRNIEEYKKGSDPTDYDSDDDGYSDKVDEFPMDPDQYKRQSSDNGSDLNIIILIIAVIVVIIILVILQLTLFTLKKKRHPEEPPSNEDVKYRKLMQEVLNYNKDTELSDEEFIKILETKFQNGEVSEETYNDMKVLIMEQDQEERKY